MPRRTRQRGKQQLRFEQRLVLNQWLLNLFEVGTFDDLARSLKDPAFEGFEADNTSRFYQNLRLLFDREELPHDLLLLYDQNIVRHWKAITRRRNAEGHTLFPKYFQYLSLLFAEIYLDRYSTDADALLSDLNAYVGAFNRGEKCRGPVSDLFASGLPDGSKVKPYEPDDLNKLAFWSATGSGKTLLMHCNIMQYRHYLAKAGRERDLNRVILLTPNEGLSLQHLGEFELSDMQADLFSKDGRSLFAGHAVEIIDIHKLREESGEKTVAIDAFEGNNLVLVDEGHRGASSAEVGHWMQMRNRLCERGFSFEYSATFGQAMKASGDRELEQKYAKCILFDYSYKYFYGDGYGKDYRIFNLEEDDQSDVRRRYLTACLLAFYQQQKLYAENTRDFLAFLIDHPLWVFVGGSVTKKPSKKDVSDVVDILLFLAGFVRDRATSVADIDRFLRGRSGLLDANGNDLFATAFPYVHKLGMTADAAFDDIIKVLFNAATAGMLHLDNLKGTEGEVGLRVGDNDYFGVINVGDPAGLCKLADVQDALNVEDREFAGSLFRDINDPSSRVHVLIGAKKFTEGWNSWRVATMGLMNIGRSEGSQIIQLFGRGVRLKGYEFSLKRSRRIVGLRAPSNIETLETLNIFGVRADYMREFKKYLEDEGLPANEERIEFVLPVVKDLGKKKLKIVRVKEGADFKRHGPKPALGPADDRKMARRVRVTVDWYPKIQAMASAGGRGPLLAADRHEAQLTAEHLAFLDFDAVYFNLQQLKNERAWYNFNLQRQRVAELLGDPSWYRLLVPPEEMDVQRYGQVRAWQEIANVLLKKYCDRYYTHRKAEWENDHLECRDLTEDDPNFIAEYRFLIEQSRDEIVSKLEEIEAAIKAGKLKSVEFQGLDVIAFSRHLYQPLIHVSDDLIEVRPVVLENPGERDFVLDLQTFCDGNKGFFKGKELYLLRNLSRGRGIGFFEAGNFHPDFILWLLDGDQQYVNFVDPKGLRNVDGPTDPKIEFHQTIKELESRLFVPGLVLNSFIISTTPLPDVSWWSNGMTKAEFEAHHVLFQIEDRATYVQKLITMAMASDAGVCA